MEDNWSRALIVALGGALGAALRYLVSYQLTVRFGTDYPWGTTVVNIAGAFAFGAVWSGCELSSSAPLIRLFVLTGLLGGLTTFSSLAFEVTNALLNDRVTVAFTHTLVHLVAGLLAIWLGLGFGRMLLRVGS